MKKPTELDLAELKHDFRSMYKNIGLEGCLQVVYEFAISMDLLLTVIQEELKNERN